MNAFDKQSKPNKMPSTTWAIQDTNTGLWCDHYSTNLNFCHWSDVGNAQTFATETQVNAAIDSWGLGVQTRFIGSNPPHPPK